MKSPLESAEKVVVPLIQFEGADVGHEWPTNLLLAFLKFVSRCYLFGVKLRLWMYRDGVLRRFPLGSRIIRVGNITAGGTGKTPMVEALARELQSRGRKVAILSRGYRSESWEGSRKAQAAKEQRTKRPIRVVSTGEGEPKLDSRVSGDEPYMLAINLKGVAVLVDKNRVESGRYAVKTLGCDTLLLDDGFQYLRLQDGIDMVLVDCTNPFGNGQVIPRGVLREPIKQLRRAKYICITKAKGRDTTALRKRLKALNPIAGIIECAHEPKVLREVYTHVELPLEALNGKKVVAFSGIATPVAFENSLTSQGARLLGVHRFADHHRYTQRELQAIQSEVAEKGAEMVVTTEKDAVRIPGLENCPVPVYYLRIELVILKGHEEFERCIQEITGQA